MRERARGVDHAALGRPACFVAGFVVLLGAVAGPLDEPAAQRLTWHMIQHLVLVAVVAPLLAAWRPRSLPRACGVGPGAAAGAGWLAVVLAWHVPALYDAALRSEPVHGVEHVSLVASSVVLCSALRAVRPRGIGVLVLHVATLVMSVVGLAMTFASRAWYSPYVDAHGANAALADQRLAGVLMWSAGGMATATAAVVLFARWLALAPTAHVDGTVPA